MNRPSSIEVDVHTLEVLRRLVARRHKAQRYELAVWQLDANRLVLVRVQLHEQMLALVQVLSATAMFGDYSQPSPSGRRIK